MNRDEILRKLREYKIDSGGKHRVSELGVFGSVARGEDQEDSDVDIVRLRGGMNPRLKERILAEARFV